MGAKYVTLPRSHVDENGDADAAESLARTIYEPERGPTDTGLIDKRGVKLYRLPETRPIGFFAKWKD